MKLLFKNPESQHNYIRNTRAQCSQIPHSWKKSHIFNHDVINNRSVQSRRILNTEEETKKKKLTQGLVLHFPTWTHGENSSVFMLPPWIMNNEELLPLLYIKVIHIGWVQGALKQNKPALIFWCRLFKTSTSQEFCSEMPVFTRKTLIHH